MYVCVRTPSVPLWIQHHPHLGSHFNVTMTLNPPPPPPPPPRDIQLLMAPDGCVTPLEKVARLEVKFLSNITYM